MDIAIESHIRGYAVRFCDSAGEHLVEGFPCLYGALRFAVCELGIATQEEAQRFWKAG